MSTGGAETTNPNSVAAGDLSDCLVRLGRVIQRFDDEEKLLRAILEECKDLLRCEAASLALYDAERRDLAFTVAAGGAEQGIRQWRVPISEGIVGYVARTREAAICNDPAHDSRWQAKAAQAMSFETRNLAAAPLTHRDELIGVIEVLNHPSPRGFGAGELALLQVFADQAAAVLAMRRLMSAQQESARLATFAVALADISHTIKNILLRLQFPSSLIEQAIQKGDQKALSAYWPPLKRATAEIGQLVQDMLTFSRPRAPEIEAVDVVALAREAVEAWRAEASGKGVELRLTPPDDALVWPLDPKALRAALNNLVGNAIEAIAEHGGHEVEVAVERRSDPDQLAVRVRDDGPGIPLEIQNRIFDPFFSTKKSKGTGLGLANVKKSVEEHDGRVLLTSEPGGGAEFLLLFPDRPAGPAASA